MGCQQHCWPGSGPWEPQLAVTLIPKPEPFWGAPGDSGALPARRFRVRVAHRFTRLYHTQAQCIHQLWRGWDFVLQSSVPLAGGCDLSSGKC